MSRVSERFTFRKPAGEPGSPAQYTPENVKYLIYSQFMTAKQYGGRRRYGLVVAAEAVEDGAAALLTVEVPDGTLPL
jgi:hypothetical protein